MEVPTYLFLPYLSNLACQEFGSHDCVLVFFEKRGLLVITIHDIHDSLICKFVAGYSAV